VGKRHPDLLSLPAVDQPAVAGRFPPEATRDTGGVDPVATVGAGAVGVHERCDDEIADGERRHGVAHLLDDADELMSDPFGLGVGLVSAIRPQIRTANACGNHADDRVAVVHQLRVRNVFAADVARAMDQSRSHVLNLPTPMCIRPLDQTGWV